ncbi:MAG: transposase [Planctomycetes bacterium]|nr:transposase [Planctomycetota bacterium]
MDPLGFQLAAAWPENLRRSRSPFRYFTGLSLLEFFVNEGKNAVKWTKLSCRTFKDNQTRLQLFALAYNLANFLRRLAVPRSIRHWSLTTLREKLIKIGAKVVRHSKYVTFQLAEVAVTRELFVAIVARIERLRSLALQPSSG